MPGEVNGPHVVSLHPGKAMRRGDYRIHTGTRRLQRSRVAQIGGHDLRSGFGEFSRGRRMRIARRDPDHSCRQRQGYQDLADSAGTSNNEQCHERPLCLI